MATFSIEALIEAIRRRVSPPAKGADPIDYEAQAGRQGAEEVSKVMPRAVMPRRAVEKKREQYAQIDRMLRENR